MIVVSNTKELEEKFDLNNIRDDEIIRVVGGLEGKNKYMCEPYISRTTYTAKTLKLIISQMKIIESRIPNEWNEVQKAKYIYLTLGKNISYEYDKEKRINGRCSNLTGLVTGKAICAGYSLIFKEMMDRQGIQCDYIRGISKSEHSSEKHAWNVLTIGGVSFPIDLTWDSCRLNKGVNELNYFGTDQDFSKRHHPDNDEIKYNYQTLNKKYVDSVSFFSPKQEKTKVEEWQKKNAIDFAIKKTYEKLANQYGGKIAEDEIKTRVVKYVNQNNINFFTRDDNAREQMAKIVTVSDAIRIMSQSYVRKTANQPSNDILSYAINVTTEKYGEKCASEAIEKYIKTGTTLGFTRENGARTNIQISVDRENALKSVISEYVQEQLRQIAKENQQVTSIENNVKKYYKANDFCAVSLPEKQKGIIIRRALRWIQEKTKEVKKYISNNRNENNINKDDNER